MRVAETAGYVYSWSTSASEVTLSRPGLTVVLRPGTRRYEVNERVEYASEPPVYENGDLTVPADVVRELRVLAGRNADVRAMECARTGSVIMPAAAKASGTLTLSARAMTGREAISIDGTAPASVPVTLTLVGSISRDMPDVLVRRITLVTDGTTFHATVPVAPAMPRGSHVTITATSLPGIAPVSASVLIDAPNPGLDSKFDHLPKDPIHAEN
jgi:hypothetical protein